MLSRWTLVLATLALVSAPGCGLVLDSDPPDPQPGFDAGIRRDAGPSDDAGSDCSIDIECDDGLYCNGLERCERDACVAGTPPCDTTARGCNSAVCDELEGRCAPNVVCPDGQVCSPEGACVSRSCITAADCPVDPDDNRCTGFNDCVDAVCQFVRGPMCNSPDSCITARCDPATGMCRAGTPDSSRCADVDGFGCTVPTCTGTGTCVEMPDHMLCPEDGHSCTTPVCRPDSGCGFRLDSTLCDDGIACTLDLCEPGRGGSARSGCVNIPEDRLCDVAGLVPPGACVRGVCVGVDAAGSPAIPGLPLGCGVTLDPSRCGPRDRCGAGPTGGIPMCGLVPTTLCSASDGSCDDGNPCNGREVCVMGICAASTDPYCPDSGCEEGYCDLGPPIRCRLRSTPACFPISSPKP